MKAATRRSRRRRAPASAGARRPKATTFRLEPKLWRNLTVLARELKQTRNRLVNDAVRRFTETRSAELQADLERALERVKALREQDPGFESAIARFVEAEAALGRDDPMEGKAFLGAGAAQRMVRNLLRG